MYTPDIKCNVVKRDGSIVEFNKEKIINAIVKAIMDVNLTKRNDDGIGLGAGISVTNDVLKRLETIELDDNRLGIETIQDVVEECLMDKYPEVAKSYILYRDKRNKAREYSNDLIKQIMTKTNAEDVVNANANVDEKSFSGRKQEASSYVQKKMALDYVMPPHIAKGHNDGWIYQHDLDCYNVGSHNCLFIDFEKVFKKGFVTRNGDVRTPSRLSTACQQAAVIFQCNSQVQFGGVASVHMDMDLEPYVKKSFIKLFKEGLRWVENNSQYDTLYNDDEIYLDNSKLELDHSRAYRYAKVMLEKEGRQSAEALWHNLGTLESRQGSQVPFTSINFGRSTTTEGRLVTKWFLNASIEGIGQNHLTSIFPISIFSYKKGVNADPGDPNYDLKRLALKSLSKRIYPNFANGDWSQAHEDPNDPDTIFATMGCRTLIGHDIYGDNYKRVGRGNAVPITLILPKLGIEYGICLGERTEPDLEGFWNKFEEVLELQVEALVDRMERIKSQHPKSAPFMYINESIIDANKCIDTVEPSIKHCTLAMGFIGVAEMCEALFGTNHAKDEKVREFALSVVKRIYDKANESKDKYKYNFSCYATPAENLCHTALKHLRSQYGIIKNVTDREFLTNSHHVPVWEKVSIYDKLNIEAPFTKYCTGGCITYIECESSFMNNLDVIEDIIRYAFEELDIPYLAFNFPIDTCSNCGYQSEIESICPECGSEDIIRLRRVTGYLTTDYRNFNNGKIAEVNERVKHTSYTDFGDTNE